MPRLPPACRHRPNCVPCARCRRNCSLRIDDSGTNFFADYFGDFQYLQGYARKGVADYVLLGPPGRTFSAMATPLAGLSHTQGKLPDGGSWQRWTARDVPRVVPEPSMPGASDLLAYVHVSTYQDWEGVARFYWGLVKDQLRVTDEVRACTRARPRPYQRNQPTPRPGPSGPCL